MPFINYYECTECKHQWEDKHECTCNDKCPKCNIEIEPYEFCDSEGGSHVRGISRRFVQEDSN